MVRRCHRSRCGGRENKEKRPEPPRLLLAVLEHESGELHTYLEPVEMLKAETSAGGASHDKASRLVLRLVGDLAHHREKEGVLG